MSQRERGLKFSSIFSALSGLASILSFLGFSAVAIFNTVTKNWPENWHSIIVPGIIFLLSLATFITFKIFNRKIIIFLLNLFAQKNPYRLQCRKIEYEYTSPTTMKYRAEYTVVAMQTGVDFVRLRINWSGEAEGSSINLQPIQEPGFYTSKITHEGSEYGYNFYKIFSNTPINHRDKPIKLGVKIDDLIDEKESASTHLLTNVSVQTSTLIMKVIFPADMGVHNIEFLEYAHAIDDYHWHRDTDVRTEDIDGGRRSITWKVKSPIVGGKYIIKWSFVGQA